MSTHAAAGCAKAPGFWTKRLSNLYPLHLFSLLLSILVLLALSHLGIGPELDKATRASSSTTPTKCSAAPTRNSSCTG